MTQIASGGMVPYAPRTVALPSPLRGSRLTERLSDPSPDWRESAACRGEGGYGSIWLYPDMHSPLLVEQTRRRCALCPVLEQCKANQAEYSIGIVAGRVHYVRAKGPRSCAQCDRVCSGKWCSRSCMDRYRYTLRLAVVG